jgi:hypothetical protein
VKRSPGKQELPAEDVRPALFKADNRIKEIIVALAAFRYKGANHYQYDACRLCNCQIGHSDDCLVLKAEVLILEEEAYWQAQHEATKAYRAEIEARQEEE